LSLLCTYQEGTPLNTSASKRKKAEMVFN